MSIRQACDTVQMSRNAFYYQAKPNDDETIISILKKFAEMHPTYGFWKMFSIMRNKGSVWNHKRVYRVYTQMQLNIRRKMKRRLPDRIKQPLACATFAFAFILRTCGEQSRTIKIFSSHKFVLSLPA